MILNPYFEVIFAAIAWSTSGVFIKYLNLPPTTISFFRLAVPSGILLVFFAIKKTSIFKGNNKLLLAVSSLNVARTFFYFLGFTYTSIGNAVIIFFTWPVFVALLEAPFLKEKIVKKNLILIFTAFLGIVFVYMDKKISFSDRDFLGMIAMTISSLLNAVSMIAFKKEILKYSKYEMIFYQNIVGAVVFLPFIFINSPVPTFLQTSIATVYAILIGVIGFALYFSALNRIKVSTASFLSYFEPVSAVVLSVILFHEKISWNMALGGLLIIASTMILKSRESKDILKLPTE